MAEALSTTLLVSTTNPGKIVEIEAELSGLPCSLIGLADLPLALPEAVENGETFAANALIKAEHYHALSSLLVLSDDSGLEVDYLEGAPGVYSARYGGWSQFKGTDCAASRLVEGVPISQRTARFVCCLALVGNGIQTMFEGVYEGRIALEPRGANGFGYDPIFLDAELDLTFAELSAKKGKKQDAAIVERLWEGSDVS
jgi:XTP/dITP diphosphohydrolase